LSGQTDLAAELRQDAAKSEAAREARRARVVSELQATVTRLTDELRLSEDRCDVLLAIRGTPRQPLRIEKPKRSGKKNVATAVALASDWHVEERVDPRTVNGLNRYDPEIAKERASRFFERVVRLTEIQRAGTSIDTLVLWLGGDLMTGYIHEDLSESNYLSPTEAVLLLLGILESGISYLLKHGGFERIIIPCSYGNHGRTTKRSRVQTAAKNSYEWLAYHVLAQRFADEKRVEVRVSDGYHTMVNIYGVRVRFHHGDGLKYAGGIGGLLIPLRKRIDAWNGAIEADLDCLGHWHQLQFFSDAVVNGSLIGWNAYAHQTGCRFERPQQAYFLIDADRKRRTLTAPIFVD
jgi:hypothetical protein